MTVSGETAILRARPLVGVARYPQGRCLENVWRWFGLGSSTGRAKGRMNIALNAWLYADQQHPGDWNPPAGVPLFYGVSPSRNDANKRAGDITLSIGGGLQIATDVVGAKVGITTIAARARQIARPYLGWSGDLGGYDIEWVGESHTAPVSNSYTPLYLPTSNGDNMIQVIITTGAASGTVLDLAPGFLHHSGNQAEADVTRNVISNPDERHKLTWEDFQRVCLGHGIDRQFFTTPAGLKSLDAEPWGGLWSEGRAIHLRLSALEKLVTPKK